MEETPAARESRGASSVTSGYLYTVTGERRFLDEALASVRSLRRHEPEADATLVTDLREDASSPEVRDAFDAVLHPEASPWRDEGGGSTWKDNLLFKVGHVYAASPYERTFFVDTDTRFLASCADLFDLLERFDLCLCQAPADAETVRGFDLDLGSYTPYNTGVMLFRKNERTEALFRLWYRIYRDEFDDYPYGQPAFMAALLRCEHPIHSYTLQSTMNFRTPYNERLLGPVRILHGRPESPERVAEEVNRTHENRVWLAGLGVVVPLRFTVGEQLRLLRKAAVQLVFSVAESLGRALSRR